MVKAERVEGGKSKCGSCGDVFTVPEKAGASIFHICFVCGAKNTVTRGQYAPEEKKCTRLQENHCTP